MEIFYKCRFSLVTNQSLDKLRASKLSKIKSNSLPFKNANLLSNA